MKKKVVRASRSNDNSFGTAAVVLGVVSLVFPSYYGIIAGIVALLFALKQRSDNNNNWALWALILAILGIVANLIDLIYLGSTGVGVVQYIKGYS